MDLQKKINKHQKLQITVGRATFRSGVTKKKLKEFITNQKQSILKSKHWRFEFQKLKEYDWQTIFDSIDSARCQSFFFSMSIISLLYFPSIIKPRYDRLTKLEIRANLLLNGQILPFINAENIKELNFSGNFLISGKPFSKINWPQLLKLNISQNMIFQMKFDRVKLGNNLDSLDIETMETMATLNEDVSFLAKCETKKTNQSSKICFLDSKRIKQSRATKILKEKEDMVHLKELDHEGFNAFNFLVQIFQNIPQDEPRPIEEQSSQHEEEIIDQRIEQCE